MGMACFDYSKFFVLPRLQAIECYRRLFQSISCRRWLPTELKIIQTDNYAEFIDDLRHVYLDNGKAGQ